MAFPTAPDFPNITVQAGFDYDWYSEVTSYITDLTTYLALITDNDGNIDLGSGNTIEWGSSAKISYVNGKAQIASLEVDNDWTYATLSIGDDLSCEAQAVVSTLTLSGNITIAGYISTTNITDDTVTVAQIAEPDDPPEGDAVMWCSNGTGYGDVGDICIKITEASTKSDTLVDFSAI